MNASRSLAPFLARTHRLCTRFQSWVFGLGAPHLPWIGFAVLLLATVLGAIGLTLAITPELDMTHFLQGKQSGLIRERWTGEGIRWLALLYLVLDALIFVPVYGAWLIVLAVRLTRGAPPAPAPGPPAPSSWFACIAVALTLGGMLADEIENVAGLLGLAGFDVLRSWPTAAKSGLLLAAMAVVAGLLVWRFFGIGLGTAALGAARAELRRGVFDVVWRSRYSIAALAIFAGLVVVMDQSRDVLVGVAQAFQTGQALGASAVLVLSAFTLWMLAYTVWLTTRIMCRLQRPANRTTSMLFVGGGAASPQGVSDFAQWWARLLGAAPVLILATLCGAAAADAIRAQAHPSAWILLAFGAATLLGAAFFLVGRYRKRHAASQYYEATADLLSPQGELDPQRYRFFGLRPAPVALPIAALLLLIAIRGVDLMNPPEALTIPSPAFVIICLGMTLWVGVTGLVSQLALLRGTPYILGLLLLTAALGWLGWTDNHVVWTAFGSRATSGGLAWMWACQAALALVAAGAGYLAYRTATAELRRRKLALITGATLLLCIAILAASNFLVPRSLTAERSPAEPRPPLERALAAWLVGVCNADAACKAQVPGDGAPLRVYFVSSEGGGIRAAYWTALVLQELAGRIERFDERTFSISGVSGGAVGAAVYRACSAQHVDPAHRVPCIQKFSELNLLGPLLSALMFEDIVARVLPTSFCATPGCGILDRGAWFEQGMESTWQELRGPLSTSRKALGQRHLPYLLLNGTAVETAERAIASDLAIDYRYFPTARDQIDAVGHDMPLSTAAHNAARFPYVNAIGSVRRPEKDCAYTPPGKDRDKAISCGHLADGGYFDNSGGHSTADALRGLSTVLSRDTIGSLTPVQIAWLRRNLMPQAIKIRNGVEEEKEKRECSTVDPSVPRCKGRFFLLTDLLGPPVTAFNAIGTGANGRLSEALVDRTTLAVRPRRSESSQIEPVVRIDLTNNGVLYPLGWYLSVKAMCGMERQARASVSYTALCAPSDGPCLKRASLPVITETEVCKAPGRAGSPAPPG